MDMRVTLTQDAAGDRMDFTTTGGTQLNLVDGTTGVDLVGTNYVANTVTFNATMVQNVNRIVITLGSVNAGGGNLLTQAIPTR